MGIELKKKALLNLNTFIKYRVFFRARYYYPIFTLLFLDFGLTLSQFAILNSVWALTIVLFEIPFGGLADTIGRKKLLILSAILLNLELLVWLLAPINGGNMLFIFFLINRIISGLCEAASSGADEALTFDSLNNAGLGDMWKDGIAKAQKYTSLYFTFVLLVGAAVYDHNFMNYVLNFLNLNITLNQEDCIKIPIFLNQLAAIYVLYNSFKFTEETKPSVELGKSFINSFKKIYESIKWTKSSKIVIALILIMTFSESLILQFLTLMSKYWQSIGVPIAYIGFIGAGLALFASTIPSLGKRLLKRNGLKTNFTICYYVLSLSFIFISFGFKFYGIIPVIFLYGCYQLLTYFNSCYINENTIEDNRATVLSIQSMLTFSKYGLVSILYSVLAAFISNRFKFESLDQTFSMTLFSFPLYFTTTTILIYLIYKCLYLKTS